MENNRNINKNFIFRPNEPGNNNVEKPKENKRKSRKNIIFRNNRFRQNTRRNYLPGQRKKTWSQREKTRNQRENFIGKTPEKINVFCKNYVRLCWKVCARLSINPRFCLENLTSLVLPRLLERSCWNTTNLSRFLGILNFICENFHFPIILAQIWLLAHVFLIAIYDFYRIKY